MDIKIIKPLISIIICSRKQNICKEYEQNINKTIGVTFEIICIDNSKNQYSIFQAYNLGIDKSQGSFLCFIHDDIFIETLDWGIIIKEKFEKDKNLGLLGIAGSAIKSQMPSAWWDCGQEFYHINLIQHYKNNQIKHLKFGFIDSNCIEVAAIDGVFMVMKNKGEIRFNNQLTGFHGYDLNLSFEHILNKSKVMVTNEILIEHLSIGQINKSWYQSSFSIHEIYKNILPVNKSNQNIDCKKNEFNNGTQFIINAIKEREIRIAVLTWLKLFRLNPFSISHIKIIKNIFLK